MSSESADGGSSFTGASPDRVEFVLFDSLIHHLIEKGLLTRNDALSIVQTAAQVVRGKLHERDGAARTDPALSTLDRIYASFEALPDRFGRSGVDARNVHPLRPPLHGDRPRFPSDDDN